MAEPAADSSCVTERGPDFGSSEACPESGVLRLVRTSVCV